MKTCPGCGVTFETNITQQRYCNTKCAKDTYKRNHPVATGTFAMKECVDCGDPYIPVGGGQKYCKICAPVALKRIRRYHNQKRIAKVRAYQRKRYNELLRHQSKIIHRPDFIAFIKKKITERRGDMLSIKPLIVQAVNALELDYDQSEISCVWKAVEDLCRSLGGEVYGKSSKRGIIFQWEREK